MALSAIVLIVFTIRYQMSYATLTKQCIDLQYTFNNLVPETIYMFQIIARNDLGDSLSKSVKCTTDQSMYVLVWISVLHSSE
jgi:hypothetical protein